MIHKYYKTTNHAENDIKYLKKNIKIPNDIAGRGRPSDARLQLARRPSITGVGSIQALLAASGSRKVT